MTPQNFSRFIIIKSSDSEKPITKLSPFVIQKTLQSILGTPKSVKKLKDDTLLVECSTMQQTKNLLGHKQFFGLGVFIKPHPTLNSSKGVIRCRDLACCESLDEITTNLKSQAVSAVKRISIKRDEKIIQTNTYILTFSTSVLPTNIKIGYENVPVSVYVPNPLRCFRCQRFGHHETKCTSSPVCAICAHEGPDHDSKICHEKPLCTNCKGSHPVFSKHCQSWKIEKDILEIKYNQGISFVEARRVVQNRQRDQAQASSGASYANKAAPLANIPPCHSCSELIKILIEKYPHIAEDLKGLAPSSVQTQRQPAPIIPPPAPKTSNQPKKPVIPEKTKSIPPKTKSPAPPTTKKPKSTPSKATSPAPTTTKPKVKSAPVNKNNNKPTSQPPKEKPAGHKSLPPSPTPKSCKTKNNETPLNNKFECLSDMEDDGDGISVSEGESLLSEEET